MEQQQAQPSSVEEKQQTPSSSTVQVLPSSRIVVLPFAISIPSTTVVHGLEEEATFKNTTTADSMISALIGNNGIVGTITILQKQVIVWVGWGRIQERQQQQQQQSAQPQTFGKGSPVMGPMIVAMPRTNYRGAFGGGSGSSSNNDLGEPSCSHLIGSESAEDLMLATQMASRLSLRSGKAIFVSCQLAASLFGSMRSRDNAPAMDEWAAGMDHETMAHRAAALAEREIWKCLQKHDKHEAKQQ